MRDKWPGFLRGYFIKGKGEIYWETNQQSDYWSGQQKLVTVLEFSQYNRSDSLGVKPPLY
ncbi:hypothetical protein ACRGNN_002004 [Providencia stuartii]|uniref:hypothetical protein n=1 Tax=Providencia stuartii TaxID=588 RepID=UPI0018C52C7F|nr:hypothetical protein [Providencia stuartii]EMD1717903.1 hypothetical protein [Providencia stuartii]MBG5908189.1 hypothetical protein [Providencia stuartii]WAZ76756.1 hypothetical protein O4Z98_12375 [Providencia stuartii]HEM6894477.1 hypothetical protein [Providencia stuartii]